jgi:hypothetical protein
METYIIRYWWSEQIGSIVQACESTIGCMSSLARRRKQIAGMLNKGWESARVLRRTLLLRQLDQGQTAGQVASQVGVASKTVRAIADRLVAQDYLLHGDFTLTENVDEQTSGVPAGHREQLAQKSFLFPQVRCA